jgi:hypothetical protein
VLPTDALQTAAAAVRVDIDRQIAQGEDAAEVVKALEEQYDAFVRGRQTTNLLDVGTDRLPTADELGAELERFLAEQANPGDQPPS